MDLRSRTATLDLFLAHRNALIDYASRLVGSRANGEDLVQEAWLRLDQAQQSEPVREPLAYLHRVIRNLAVDGRRRRVRERLVVVESGYEHAVANSPDDSPTPEAAALQRDEHRRLMEAIAELPERTRIALEMHRFGECKLREIAAFLGISTSFAHLLVAEGLEHCKRRLARR